jgi:hypothetical protein
MERLPSLEELQKANQRFAPTRLEVDLSSLPEHERSCLRKLVEAAQRMDAIYLRQVWSGNTSTLMRLAEDTTPLGRERLRSFLINKGPWSRLDHDAPFVPNVPKTKPPEGNFYPPGATKAELEEWLQSLSEGGRDHVMGYYNTLRRGPDGVSILPQTYGVEYQAELAEAAQLLREAAALTRQNTLKDFLLKRADAFISDDYYASEVAWMNLDASIEPTIGPYEVYEDGWFNAKAAFEAFITVRDDAETKKLEQLSGHLQDLEDHLPIEPDLRNPKLGALAPLRVVNQIFCAGDANHSVQTAAFNLPNDIRIVQAMGAKRVMLRNVQLAKFDKVLLPITRVALSAEDQKRVSFDAFFTHIVMHELMHALGPTKVRGRSLSVRQAMEEVGSALEEAKADISGLWALQHLVDKRVLDRSLEQTMYVTFLASTFRSIRFGLNEAHGRGTALQLNALLDAGAFRVDAKGTFSVDATQIKGAVSALTGEIMMLQASGDLSRARSWLERMCVVRPEVRSVLSRLGEVPVDIAPEFVTAEELLQMPTPGRPGNA